MALLLYIIVLLNTCDGLFGLYMLSRSPIRLLDGLIFLILSIVYGQGQGIDVLGATCMGKENWSFVCVMKERLCLL